MSNEYIGKHFLSDTVYREADGLANSDALMIADNPSDLMWSKSAPRDASKAQTTDIGTALHCLLLEPEKYKESVLVASVKGRNTKKFEEEQSENPDKLVITQDEYDHIENMGKSVMAHPTAFNLLQMHGDCESSVFVKDAETGVLLKCRPDKDAVQSSGIIIDVKTTADLEDWRSDKEFKNPLYKFNYGHQASFYTDCLEQHYGVTIDSFIFLVIQKSIKLGRYPVGIFQISRSELVELGFWAKHRENIEEFKRCTENDDWIHTEQFKFYSDEFAGDDMVITFEGENNA